MVIAPRIQKNHTVAWTLKPHFLDLVLKYIVKKGLQPSFR